MIQCFVGLFNFEHIFIADHQQKRVKKSVNCAIYNGISPASFERKEEYRAIRLFSVWMQLN